MNDQEMRNEVERLRAENKRLARNKAAMRSTLEVLDDLKTNRPELWSQADVVGRWVWITFESMPAAAVREFLLDAGFHWNRARGAWQHACGAFTGHSPGDPRWKYGSVKPAELEEQRA